MRKILPLTSLLTSLTLFGTAPLQAQTDWQTQNPFPSSGNLYDAHFMSVSEGWVVGEGGLILYTTDKGVSWTRQRSNTLNSLLAVHFPTASTGYTVGWGGTIRKTADGGNTWTVQHSGLEDDFILRGVHFVHPDTGWVVGGVSGFRISEANVILHTKDGGNTWVQQTTPVIRVLYSVHFANKNKGWCAGASGTILHTTNGGEDWETQDNPVSSRIADITFVDEDKGWAVGGSIRSTNYILQTIDGGESWRTQRENLREDERDFTTLLNKVSFVDENHGWAVGANGLIAHTSNGGVNWNIQTNPLVENGLALLDTNFSDALFSVYPVHEDRAWIVGEVGNLLLTENAGAQWDVKSNGTHTEFEDAFFVSATEGWAVAYAGIIFHTTDGGNTWTRQGGEAVSNYIFRDIYFIHPDTGWVVGQAFVPGRREGGSIFYTTNGGDTWTEQKITPEHLDDVHFVNSDTGWAVGRVVSLFGDIEALWYTDNGGSTWTDRSYPGFLTSGFIPFTVHRSVHFVHPDTGWVVGDAGNSSTFAVYTDDGGATWSERLLFPHISDISINAPLEEIFFLNSKEAWAVGGVGAIFHTADGGDTWENQSTGGGNLHDVHFVNSDTGYAVGDRTILYTENGGDSWATLAGIDQGTNQRWNTIEFFGEDHGWIMGISGAILHTSNGGIPSPLPPRLDITHSALEGPQDEGDLFAFSVSSNVPWEITDDADWLTFTPDNSGTSVLLTDYTYKSVQLRYTENLVPAPREALITFTAPGYDALAQTFTFRQAAGTASTLTIEVQSGVDTDGLRHDGGNFAIEVSSNTDWTVSDGGAPWITLVDLGNTGRDDGFSANGAGTMRLVYVDNPVVAERSATVTFTTDDGMVTRMEVFTQKGKPHTIRILSNTSGRWPSTEGVLDVEISSNATWRVNVQGGVTWARVTDTDDNTFVMGDMEGTVRIHYMSNEALVRRVVDVSFVTIVTPGNVIDEEVVRFIQDGVAPVFTVDPPSRAEVSSAAGTLEVMVESNVGWTVGVGSASNPGDMITLLSDGVAMGEGSLASFGSQTLTVTYAENLTASPRTAAISLSAFSTVPGVDVSGLMTYRLSIVQAAAMPSLSIMAETGLNLEDRAGEEAIVLNNAMGSFTVTVRSNTTWTLTETAFWIQTTNADGNPLAGGLGDEEVQVRYDANRRGAAERDVALITFSAVGVAPSGLLVLRVTQVAGPPALNFAVTEGAGVDADMLSPQAGTVSFMVSSNREWAVDDGSADWVSELSDGTAMDASLLFSDNNQTLTVSYLANTTGSERSTNLTFSDATGPVRGIETLQTLRLAQAPFSLDITPPTQTSLGAGGGTSSIGVASNTDWSVQAGGSDATTLIIELSDGTTRDASSLTSSGDKTLTVRYAPNTNAPPRQARLVFSSTNVPLDPLHTIMLTQGPPAPFLTITPPAGTDLRDLGTAAGSFTIAVESNTEWTVQTGGSDAAALITRLSAGTTSHASRLSSRGNELVVSYSENPVPDSGTRTAMLSFTANGVSMSPLHRVMMTQAAENPVLTILPTVLQELLAVRGSFTIAVTSNTDWEVDDDGANWIQNLSDGTNDQEDALMSNGSKTVTVEYSSNEATSQRETVLRFMAMGVPQRELMVRQRGTVPDPSFAAFSTSNAEMLPHEANSLNISVASNTDWRVDDGDSDWVSELAIGTDVHTGTLSSNGGRTLVVRYAENMMDEARDATLHFEAVGISEPLRIDLRQLASPPVLDIAPLEAQSIGAAEGSLELMVTSNTDWTVHDGDATWITELSDGENTHADRLMSGENKTLTIRYTANSAEMDRSATLRFETSGLSPRRVEITQGGNLIAQTPAADLFLDLWLYPVPAQHRLHVETAADAQASIYDAQGAFMATYFLQAGRPYTLSLEHYKAGLYLLELRTEEGRTVRRFLRR